MEVSMKRKVCMMILLLSLTIITLASCKKDDNNNNGTDGMNLTPGTYEGTGKGNNGDIKVRVTLTKDKIDKIEILEEEETEGIKEPAIEQIPAKIIEKQSVEVDVVAGATWTSKGIMEAVEKALEAAGADTSKFKNTGAKEDNRSYFIQRTIGELKDGLTQEVFYSSGSNETQQMKVSIPYLNYSKDTSKEVLGKSINRNAINYIHHEAD